jgi:hypothetical protein
MNGHSRKAESFLLRSYLITEYKQPPQQQSRSRAMIRADEIRKRNGQIQFSLTVLETAQLRPKPEASNIIPTPSFTYNGIDLSGSHLLVGCISALVAVGLLLWAFLKLWLFE